MIKTMGVGLLKCKVIKLKIEEGKVKYWRSALVGLVLKGALMQF
jgi:hypothetical protein